MTEAEFRAAVSEVFPRHQSMGPVTPIANEWHTSIGMLGEVFSVAWIPNARRGIRWHVRAGCVESASGTLKSAVEEMVRVQLRIARMHSNMATAIQHAKK